MSSKIPLSRPSTGLREAIAVGRAVNSGWLTQFGSETTRMESNIRMYFEKAITGEIDVTTTSNGTTALHLALLSLNIVEGDEVIVPNLCYIAVPNAVLYCSATPVAVDVSSESWNADSEKIVQAITAKTRAIILVDNYGRKNNVNLIRKLIPSGIPIILDSAESFPHANVGTEPEDVDLLTASCYANKILTTGEGGFVVGKKQYLERIKTLKNQSQNPSQKFSHTEIGFNYRLTNMQAALFNVQWGRRHKLLRVRKNLFHYYTRQLKLSKIIWETNYDNECSPWLFTISIRNSGVDIPTLIEDLRRAGIECRPGFTPISKTAYLRGLVKLTDSLENSERLSSQIISLPTYPGLRKREIRRIVRCMEKAIYLHV